MLLMAIAVVAVGCSGSSEPLVTPVPTWVPGDVSPCRSDEDYLYTTYVGPFRDQIEAAALLGGTEAREALRQIVVEYRSAILAAPPDRLKYHSERRDRAAIALEERAVALAQPMTQDVLDFEVTFRIPIADIWVVPSICQEIEDWVNANVPQ